MHKKAKKIWITSSVIVLCVGTFAGIKLYLDSSNTIDVESVANLNTGYWDDPMSSTGFVSNSDSQSIYYDASKSITNVYVQNGQSVNAGDPLLAYDTSTLQTTVDSNQIDIEKIQNAITLAKHELQTLSNTKPIPNNTPEPTIEPTPAEPIPAPLPSLPKSDENGNYPYILSLSQAQKNITDYKIYYISIPTEEGEEPIAPEDGPNKNTDWQTERIKTEYGKICYYWIEYTYTDGSNNTYKQEDAQSYINDTESIPSKSIALVGEKDNPYTFHLNDTEDAKIYGKLFNDNADLDAYFTFQLYADDEIETTWTIKSSKFPTMEDGESISLMTFSRQQQEYIESPIENTTEEEEAEPISGYTEIELAKAIRDKKYELCTLDLDLRKAQLTLQENQALLSDGIVRAKKRGTVQLCNDINNPPQDGSAMLTVMSGNGYTIIGSVSELLLNTVKIGDTITAYSWTSGTSCQATIESINTYPSTNNAYNGTGNPNVSYYDFTAYVNDDTNLNPGEYLELTLDSSQDTSNSIWLSKAYVKNEGNSYYVFKDDNGKLIKQPVKVGRIVWGDTMEITDGLTDTDYIAFAYSKNAKQGTKTKNADSSSEVTYD